MHKSVLVRGIVVCCEKRNSFYLCPFLVLLFLLWATLYFSHIVIYHHSGICKVL